MGYGDFINEYGGDGRISRGDIKKFRDAGGSASDAQKFLEYASQGKKGFDGKVGSGAYASAAKTEKFDGGGVAPSNGSGSSTGPNGWDIDKYYGDLGPGMTPAMFEQLGAETLAHIQGGYGVAVADSYGASNVLVQELISDSNDYANELNLEGTKYTADRSLDIAQYQSDSQERWRKYIADVEAENNLAVQGLKNQGAIDLQAIVNTGLTDVADIQGTYASERVQLQGEYDVERANIQSDFEKFKAARAKEGQIYGSLMAGFWS